MFNVNTKSWSFPAMHVFFEVVKFKGQMGYYGDLIKSQGPAKLKIDSVGKPAIYC